MSVPIETNGLFTLDSVGVLSPLEDEHVSDVSPSSVLTPNHFRQPVVHHSYTPSEPPIFPTQNVCTSYASSFANTYRDRVPSWSPLASSGAIFLPPSPSEPDSSPASQPPAPLESLGSPDHVEGVDGDSPLEVEEGEVIEIDSEEDVECVGDTFSPSIAEIEEVICLEDAINGQQPCVITARNAASLEASGSSPAASPLVYRSDATNLGSDETSDAFRLAAADAADTQKTKKCVAESSTKSSQTDGDEVVITYSVDPAPIDESLIPIVGRERRKRRHSPELPGHSDVLSCGARRDLDSGKPQSSTTPAATAFLSDIDKSVKEPCCAEDDNMEESDIEDAFSSAPPVATRITSPVTLSILTAVQRLHSDEVERECVWSAWLLQEALGDRLPYSIKRINEPGLSMRPLRSLRYTTSSEPSSVPLSHWVGMNEPITAGRGTLCLQPEALSHFRSMMCYPIACEGAPDYAADGPLCRFCGSIECAASRHRRCRKIRCARCCQEGHSANRCYQATPEAWLSRCLSPLDLSYLASIRCNMLNGHANTDRSGCGPRCIVCDRFGHTVCGNTPAEPPGVGTTPGGRFLVLSCSDVEEALRTHSSLQQRALSVRWDADAVPFQRYTSALRIRYCVDRLEDPATHHEMQLPRPPVSRRHSETFSDNLSAVDVPLPPFHCRRVLETSSSYMSSVSRYQQDAEWSACSRVSPYVTTPKLYSQTAGRRRDMPRVYNALRW